MNEMDQLSRFRDTAPFGVSPRAEQLFRAALREEEHYPERRVVPRSRNPLTRIWSPWRLGIAALAGAALVAGLVVAVLPGAPRAPAGPGASGALTVKLLADRASAAALTQPTVNPGQWVYRVIESHLPSVRRGIPSTRTGASWETADGEVNYGNSDISLVDPGDSFPGYSQLGSLPRDPAALDAYLAHLVYPDSKPTRSQAAQAAFNKIDSMLQSYVLPPAIEAELYQALAAIPEVQLDSHVTAIDGQAGVAFVLPRSPQGDKEEIILNASTYSFLAHGSWGARFFHEIAVVRTVLVGAPGSTQPSVTPPTAAELLAEQADLAVSFTTDPWAGFVEPSTWILRELATSSGDQTVWATSDDSEQASYVNGKLTVCSRSAACAASTRWLMPAGPSYTLVNPVYTRTGTPPMLPDTLPQLLAVLNSYDTGCADVAGDCNAVNAMTNMIAGYASNYGPLGDWFLMLADIPGVTAQRVTDVAGQADLAFRYPFTDGITEILFSASTHQFVGFVRDGAETVVTKDVTVSGPGSYTPVVIRPGRP
jgi:hypothetical protein